MHLKSLLKGTLTAAAGALVALLAVAAWVGARGDKEKISAAIPNESMPTFSTEDLARTGFLCGRPLCRRAWQGSHGWR